MTVIRNCRLWPVALAGFVWMSPSSAAEPLAGILACRAVADPAARLACFDRESAGLAAAPATTATTPAPTIPMAAPPTAASAPAGAVSGAPTVDSTTASKANFGLSAGEVAKKEVAAGKRPADVKDIQVYDPQNRGARTIKIVRRNGKTFQLGAPTDSPVMSDPEFNAKLRRIVAAWHRMSVAAGN